MMLSVTSDYRPMDLLSGQEEEILAALIAFISQRSDQAKTGLVKSLSKLLVVSYHVGADRAAREIGTKGTLGIEGLNPVIKRLGAHLDGTFGSLSGELTDAIEGGIRQGWSYDHVTKEVAGKLKGKWGKDITFNSVGQVRRSVQIDPNGSMKWIEKTITKPITLPADTYAETLTRTIMKSAYAQGHYARYEDAGYSGWVYLSVADERTRPRHLALHGRVFQFGTKDDEMAREVMKEYRCRCRPKAYFGDPKLDTPSEAYHKERAAWAQQALGELPDGDKEGDQAKFLQAVISHSAAAA